MHATVGVDALAEVKRLRTEFSAQIAKIERVVDKIELAVSEMAQEAKRLTEDRLHPEATKWVAPMRE
jgi:hypothetical protein